MPFFLLWSQIVAIFGRVDADSLCDLLGLCTRAKPRVSTAKPRVRSIFVVFTYLKNRMRGDRLSFIAKFQPPSAHLHYRMPFLQLFPDLRQYVSKCFQQGGFAAITQSDPEHLGRNGGLPIRYPGHAGIQSHSQTGTAPALKATGCPPAISCGDKNRVVGLDGRVLKGGQNVFFFENEKGSDPFLSRAPAAPSHCCG